MREEAKRGHVVVGKNGRVDLPPVDLPEGTEAEYVLYVSLPSAGERRPSIVGMIGCLRGTYGSVEEIDANIRAERDSWDR